MSWSIHLQMSTEDRAAVVSAIDGLGVENMMGPESQKGDVGQKQLELAKDAVRGLVEGLDMPAGRDVKLFLSGHVTESGENCDSITVGLNFTQHLPKV